MSAGKLTSALIQKSFTTQHKSPNCTKSTNAGLVDFSKGTVTFCSSFTPTGLLKITSAVGEKSPYLPVHHQGHSASQGCFWTALLTSAHQEKPIQAAAWRTAWDSISFWRVFGHAGCGAEHQSLLFSKCAADTAGGEQTFHLLALICHFFPSK